MRIESLSVTNFQQIATAAFQFRTSAALIFGRNWHGKTSLARAVEVLLRGGIAALEGHSELTIGRIARAGAEHALVEGVLVREGVKPVRIERRITARGVSTRVNAGAVNKAAFDFYAPPGIVSPDAAFRVVTQTEAFFGLKPAVQKAVLESLVDQRVGAEVAGLPFHRLGDPAPLVQTLKDVATAYDVAYERRRAQRAKLLALPVLARPEAPRQDVATIEARLSELRARERTLLTQAGARSGERAALQRQADRLAETVDKLAVQLDELRGAEGEGAEEALAAEMARARDEVAHARGSHEAYRTNLTTTERLESQQMQVRAKLNNLPAVGSACPMCGVALTEKSRAATAEAWRKEGETLGTEIAVLRRKLKQPPQIERIEKRLDDASDRRSRLRETSAHYDAGRTALATLREKIERAPEDTGPDPALAETQERVATGARNLAMAQDINRGHDEYERVQPQRDALTQELGDLERLVAACGPDGIRATLVVQRFGTMLAQINDALAAFELSLEVRQEPWELLIDGQPPILMAESQRFLCGIALQLAVAAATGIRLAVVDGASVLDGPNRGAFFSTLERAIKGGLDQVLVFATYAQDAALTAPMPEWMQRFVVERPSKDAGSSVRAL